MYMFYGVIWATFTNHLKHEYTRLYYMYKNIRVYVVHNVHIYVSHLHMYTQLCQHADTICIFIARCFVLGLAKRCMLSCRELKSVSGCGKSDSFWKNSHTCCALNSNSVQLECTFVPLLALWSRRCQWNVVCVNVLIHVCVCVCSGSTNEI